MFTVNIKFIIRRLQDMSEEKVSYRIVTENNIVIEAEPKTEKDEQKDRLKEIAALLSEKKEKED